MAQSSSASTSFLYRKVARQICDEFQETSRLPSERDLADRYGCTRNTIRSALKLLQEENLLHHPPNRKKRSLVAADAPPPPTDWQPAALLLGQENLKDANYMDFVAGCLDQAQQERLLLTTQTVPPAEENAPSSLEALHPGIRPAGYLIATRVSDPMLKQLARTRRPCIVMGNHLRQSRLPEINQGQYPFFECYLPQEDKYEGVLRKLLDLGHTRILGIHFKRYETMVRRLYQEYGKPFENFGTIEIPWSIQNALKPMQEKSAEIAEAARRYTAMLVPFGNVISFDIYMALRNAGIRIPDDLSLIYASGKPEWFVPYFKISTLFSSAWDEGVNCIKELSRQIRSGEPVGGVHYTEYRFIDSGTIAPPTHLG